MGWVLDIARHENGFPACCLHEALGLPGIFILVVVADQHIRALAGIGQRYSATDATVSAGDDRFLVGQAARALVAVLAVVGLRIHRRAGARHWLLLIGEGGLGKIRGHDVDPKYSRYCCGFAGVLREPVASALSSLMRQSCVGRLLGASGL